MQLYAVIQSMRRILVILLLVYTGMPMRSTAQAEWLVMYYMPYDNDLSKLGKEIIFSIKKGITSKDVMAVVQADFDDTLGMQRFVLTADTIIAWTINNEYSANDTTFYQFLQWAGTHYRAQRYGLFLLNHGGRLEDVCRDDAPEQKYLNILDVRKGIEKFNAITHKKLELLTLQVCTKASLEALYEFKDISHYTLASQQLLGAPNSYYIPTYEALSNQPKTSGKELAEWVAKNEGSDMYYSYTCVNNSYLDSMALALQQLKKVKKKAISKVADSTLLKIDYLGETYCDLSSMMSRVLCKNEVPLPLIQTQRVLNKLVVFHQVNANNNKMKHYGGVSLLHPAQGFYRTRYRHLSFFKTTSPKAISAWYKKCFF